MPINDVTEMRELVDSWANAVRDEDIEGILAHHADDMVMFDVPPPFQSNGSAAYERTWKTFFSWSNKPVVFNVSDFEIFAGDGVAFGYGKGECGGTDTAGKSENLTFRLTMGFRKIDGSWCIVHEHHSLPSET